MSHIPCSNRFLDAAPRVCKEHLESVTQQMRLPVLEAIVQQAPHCLRVQRQPAEFFNLLAGAIAAVLLLNGMSVPQCRAARHEAVWKDCCS